MRAAATAIVGVALVAGVLARDEGSPNTLTAKERAGGWRLLFDGKTTNGWRGYRQQTIPAGWKALDQALTRVGEATDIVTVDEFDNFELTIDWNIAPGGNSGILYRVTEDDDVSWKTAPEYQVIDHNYREALKPGQLTGANYDLNPPSRDVTKPAGTWNATRIVARGNHVEHWLNGVKIVEYEIGSADWTERLMASKFKELPHYAKAKKGRIGLQDHGDRVAYRNIKIKAITP
jgi:hypothetical protein